MELPKIIQGGMGVAISDWRLAQAVSKQGHLGVVSGTACGEIMVCRLHEGDPGGHVRRALQHFPIQELAQETVERLCVLDPDSAPPSAKPLPMWTLKPSLERLQLTILGAFVEVFLAKEGHDNPVGVNLLEKLQLPIPASLYGAMLAGVDVVIMGAGIPMQVPGILDTLAQHADASYRLDVQGSVREDGFLTQFSPSELFPGLAEELGPLRRPFFLPIIASVVLAKTLVQKASGTVDGFVIEKPLAGGHNAPPRGSMTLDENNEPIYGAKDVVDLAKIQQLGKPYWLAGGYGHPQALADALAEGAAGIQVGTAFALCDESGMDAELKQRVLSQVVSGESRVITDACISPTGFPFKVVDLKGSLARPEVVAERERVCDRGMLRHLYKREDGGVGFRCPGEPKKQFVAKGGNLRQTEGRGCLCNGLLATAGFPNVRKDGYQEPPLVTLGDELTCVCALSEDGQHGYSARDVLEYLSPQG